jgi:acetyl-CoA synthetase
MSNIDHKDDTIKNFDWSEIESELGYSDGDVINIGWYCSDRICLRGEGQKIALRYESFDGVEKKFTFNDIRLASNTVGSFLNSVGLVHGDRICLFMDRIPELNISFLGILKIGAIAQPLFSAFEEESLF